MQSQTEEITFTPGQTVYLPNGRECVYVSKAGDVKHVVQGLVMDSETEETTTSEPFIVSRVLPFEPEDVFGPETNRSAAELDKIRTELIAARKELAEFNTLNTDRMTRLKQHKGLERLDDFLSGKITHYVEVHYSGIAITDPAKVAAPDIDKKATKLLTLFGKSNGELNWRLSYYSDGSGGSHQVYPFCSLEEAQEKVREIIKAWCEEFRADPRKLGEACKAAENAKRFGFDIPEDIAQAVHANAVKNAEERIASIRAELSKANAVRNELIGQPEVL